MKKLHFLYFLFLHFLSILTDLLRSTRSTHPNVVFHVINSFQDDSRRRRRLAGHCPKTKTETPKQKKNTWNRKKKYQLGNWNWNGEVEENLRRIAFRSPSFVSRMDQIPLRVLLSSLLQSSSTRVTNIKMSIFCSFFFSFLMF